MEYVIRRGGNAALDRLLLELGATSVPGHSGLSLISGIGLLTGSGWPFGLCARIVKDSHVRVVRSVCGRALFALLFRSRTRHLPARSRRIRPQIDDQATDTDREPNQREP